MMQLHQDYNKFKEKEIEVVVVGPDNAKKFKEYWEENGLEFYGLPDESHSVLKLYGQEVNLFKLGRMPAQMLIDKEGTFRYVHFGSSMKDIPENKEIFKLVDSF